ncbi:MAG: hypothetical protein Q8Q39_02785 [bacterium]|nr:hypothetical protein [bacterium]
MDQQALQKIENNILQRYRQAYEEHERLVWDRERELRNQAVNYKETKLPNNQVSDIITSSLDKALRNIEKVIGDAMEAVEGKEMFLGDRISSNGIGKILKNRTEADIFSNPDEKFASILKSALVNLFLDREKKGASSIYRRRIKKGFSAPVESLIQEEKQKNAEFRQALLKKYQKILPEEDLRLVDFSFRRRMARHGISVEP